VNIFRVSFVFVFLLMSFSSQAASRWNQNWDVQADGLTHYFDFSELDAGGARVHEHGALYGFKLKAARSFTKSHWYSELGYSQYGGVVAYDGRTDSGSAHTTESVEAMLDTYLTLGKQFDTWQSKNAVKAFSSVGFHYWMRDIKTRNRVVGSYGLYQWFYLQVGAEGLLARVKRWHFLSEVSFSKSLLPRISLNLKSSDLADRILEPGSHYGVSLAFPVEYHARNNLRISMRPSLRFWELGKSASVILQSPDGYPVARKGGVAPEYIYEPHSSTLMWGLSVGLEKHF